MKTPTQKVPIPKRGPVSWGKCYALPGDVITIYCHFCHFSGHKIHNITTGTVEQVKVNRFGRVSYRTRLANGDSREILTEELVADRKRVTHD